MMFKLFDTPQGLGAWFGFLLLFVNLNPLGPLMESSGLGAVFFLFANIVSDSKFLLYVLPLMEVSRLTLFALYIWAAGRCLRDQETSSAGFVLGIVVPSGCFGAGLILWLIGFAMKNVTSVWPGLIIGTFYGMALIGLLVWYIFVVGNARTMLDHV